MSVGVLFSVVFKLFFVKRVINSIRRISRVFVLPSQSERQKAMELLIFLLEKKTTNKIKSRHCANGSVQRQWMSGEDTSSPTVMTESVFLTSAIEAKENRKVVTLDIPNAFIQTPIEERDKDGDRYIMKIRGAMVKATSFDISVRMSANQD